LAVGLVSGYFVLGVRDLGWPTKTTTQDSVRGRAGWRQVWGDEFNGSTLDRTKWAPEHHGTFGDGNKELACLMDRPENLLVSGGLLILRARRESPGLVCGSKDSRFPDGRSFSSAMLTTRGTASWTYGRFEMRARLPTQAMNSAGLWPAFWMRPDSGGTGELDIMEAIGSRAGDSERNRVHQSVHYDYRGTYPVTPHITDIPRGTTTDGFHRYAVEWEKGSIKWFVDDRLTYERTSPSTPWLDSAFAKPFFLRLNLAVGGSWPGAPDSSTGFPADYAADYVRVYQR
jgi:beta-glucanase (GH16 family)